MSQATPAAVASEPVEPAPPPVLATGPARRSTVRTVLRIFRANPLSLAGFVIVGIILLLGFAVWIAPSQVLPYPPAQPGPDAWAGPSLQHPFGTDEIGEDMFSRVLAALPLDLGIGIGIAGAALLIGGLLGLVAGYWDTPWTVGGVASAAILRVADIFLAFPTLVLVLAIFGALGGGLNAAIVALLVTWWPFYARVVRGEVLAIKARPFVTAARAAGVSEGRILVRHVLRNLFEPLAVYYTLDVGTVIVTFSTVAYVGIGFPLNDLEWGNMVQYYGSQFLPAHPWPVIAAGFMIFITVLGFSLLGDGLRDVLDPRSRRVLGGVGEETGSVAEALDRSAAARVPALGEA